MLRSLFLILLAFPVSTEAARDLLVGWDYSNTNVERFELQWRFPETSLEWVDQTTIQAKILNQTVIDTSRLFKVRDINAGTFEIWCRACWGDYLITNVNDCPSPMVLETSQGCCSEWATLIINEPSTPTKPVINP